MATVYFYKNVGQNEFAVQYTPTAPTADFVFAVNQSDVPNRTDVVQALIDFRTFVEAHGWLLV